MPDKISKLPKQEDIKSVLLRSATSIKDGVLTTDKLFLRPVRLIVRAYGDDGELTYVIPVDGKQFEITCERFDND